MFTKILLPWTLNACFCRVQILRSNFVISVYNHLTTQLANAIPPRADPHPDPRHAMEPAVHRPACPTTAPAVFPASGRRSAAHQGQHRHPCDPPSAASAEAARLWTSMLRPTVQSSPPCRPTNAGMCSRLQRLAVSPVLRLKMMKSCERSANAAADVAFTNKKAPTKHAMRRTRRSAT